MYNYLDNLKVLNLLLPSDIVATATASAYINVKHAAGTIMVMVPFGAVTSTDAAKGCNIAIQASTASSSNATETAIAYKYRLSAAVATDTMGALTDVGSTGAVVTAADDNTTLFAFVEPDALAALGADFRSRREWATWPRLRSR